MKLSFFPHEIQNIKLRIPKDILINELSKHIDIGASSQIWFKKNSKSFAGRKSGEGFEISLRTTYRNHFKPKITISFFEFDHYTEIEIEYKVELFVKVIVIIFMVLIILFQLLVIPHNIQDFIDNFSLENFIPLSMILVIWIFVKMGFYMSMGHSEEILSRIFILTKKKHSKKTKPNITT